MNQGQFNDMLRAAVAQGVITIPTGDFKADGSVPMTGTLQLAGHAVTGAGNIQVDPGGFYISNVGDTLEALFISGDATKVGLFNTGGVVVSAAIADASGGGVIDAEARTALNTLLAYLRSIRLVAT